MKKLVKRYRNFRLLLRYWWVLERCENIIQQPTKGWGMIAKETFSLEEMEGVFDISHIHRILNMETGELEKDLIALKKGLKELEK